MHSTLRSPAARLATLRRVVAAAALAAPALAGCAPDEDFAQAAENASAADPDPATEVAPGRPAGPEHPRERAERDREPSPEGNAHGFYCPPGMRFEHWTE